MLCKLVHLDASLVHWFTGWLERAPLETETETKGGQKGINPGARRVRSGGLAKFLLGYLGEILSGDKDNARA